MAILILPLMIIQSFLYDRLGDYFSASRIRHCILRHDGLIICHLDLGKRRRSQTELDEFLLGLLLLESGLS